MTVTQRRRVSLAGITLRVVWTNMVSNTWGKWLLGVTALMAIVAPFQILKDYNVEIAAIAMVNRADSGGRVLIPARCDIPGAELNRDYVIANGKAIRGRVNKGGCFYTVSAFKRFFPDRYKIDNPATFRVQQLTTGTRLLVPSTARARNFLLACVLGPLGIIALGMAKSWSDLVIARAREERMREKNAEG